MTRYCAQCGSHLEETALLAGYCLLCGTEVDTADAVLGLLQAAASDTPTQTAAGVVVASGGAHEAPDPHASGAYLLPAPPLPPPQSQPQHSDTRASAGSQRHARRRRRKPRRWALVLLSAVLLLLSGAAIYALAQRGTFSIILAPFTLSNANANASSNASSQAGGTASGGHTSTGPTAQHTPTQTPWPGSTVPPTGSPTPQGSPTTTSTATPVPAILSVSPTSFSFPACLVINRAQFTISNTGGTPLSWSAAAGASGFTITPTGGNVSPGQQVLVTISTIVVPGTGAVTVSAPGARNAPQDVTVTCGV